MEMNKKQEQKVKRKEEALEIQKMESRMYENKFPNIDDLVMVRISFLLVFNPYNLRRRGLCWVIRVQ